MGNLSVRFPNMLLMKRGMIVKIADILLAFKNKNRNFALC